ncbi:hypothetical protein CR513_49522, partial [Mucuna pruriens]
MEDETSGKGSTLILGRPFLMTARMKIDVHARTLSMEFGDTLVQFNIFDVMKHLFGIDLIDELVEECLQQDNSNEGISSFAEDTDSIGCLGSLTEEADHDEVWEVHNLSNFEDDNTNLTDLSHKAELNKLLDQVCKYENPECSNKPSTSQLKKVETERRPKSSWPKRQMSKPTHMFMCKPRPSRPKKTRTKQESSLSRIVKVRTMFHLDPTLVQNKELSPPPTRQESILSRPKGVGHKSQRPNSCRPAESEGM